MMSITMAKLIRWSGAASILGGIIGCTRMLFKDDLLALWGMNRMIDPVFGVALLLWSLGLMGFWGRHAYTSPRPLHGLAGGVFAFYGTSVPYIVFGNPTGHPFFFVGIAIIGGFCTIWRKVGKWTTLPLVTVVLGLCSWIPVLALYVSESEASDFLRLFVVLFAFLFNLSWVSTGYALWRNTEVAASG